MLRLYRPDADSKEVRTVAKWLGVATVLAASLAAGCATGRIARGSADHPSPVARASVVQTPPKPRPPVNACAGNKAAQLVLVSIAEQRAWLCQRTRTVYSTAVTTGKNTPDSRTPTGRFRIEGRNTDTVLTPTEGGHYRVKYWIPFQAPLYGFHDSSWQKFPYGSPQYRTGGSHGCVHMPLAAMKFLYSWAKIGAAVDIRA